MSSIIKTKKTVIDVFNEFLASLTLKKLKLLQTKPHLEMEDLHLLYSSAMKDLEDIRNLCLVGIPPLKLIKYYIDFFNSKNTLEDIYLSIKHFISVQRQSTVIPKFGFEHPAITSYSEMIKIEFKFYEYLRNELQKMLDPEFLKIESIFIINIDAAPTIEIDRLPQVQKFKKTKQSFQKFSNLLNGEFAFIKENQDLLHKYEKI
jgi:hypothetical protein